MYSRELASAIAVARRTHGPAAQPVLLGSDCGISQPTAAAWLSILKTSYICLTLEPHFKNFSKRLIKSPKPYFYDTGLSC